MSLEGAAVPAKFIFIACHPRRIDTASVFFRCAPGSPKAVAKVALGITDPSAANWAA